MFIDSTQENRDLIESGYM